MAYDATDFVSQSQPSDAEKEPLSPTPRLLDRDPKSLTEPRERLEYLRDFLREKVDPAKFDMQNFSADPSDGDFCSASQVRTGCGTTACIAGWCQALFTDDSIVDGSEAERLLGLGYMPAQVLFYANAYPMVGCAPTYWDATPNQAANVLDHLLRTGEVDWSVA